MKKKNKVIILIVIISLALLLLGIYFIVNSSKKEQEKISNINSHETFKKIYETDDNVLYYSNDQEKIYKFSGYKDLDDYFYNNVTCGYDASGKSLLMDIHEKIIVQPGTFDKIKRAGKEFYYIDKDGKRGIIDYEGKIIIPAEYSRLFYHKDESEKIVYFTAKNPSEEEYYLFNEKGKLIIKNNTEIYSHDVEMYKGINEKCITTVSYKGTVYNMKNGEVLLTNIEDAFYLRNFFCKDNKLTIYDESFKVKKEIKDFDPNTDLEYDDGRWVLTIGEQDYYLNNDIELVKIDKEAEKRKFIKEEGFTEIENGEYHILENGSKYITKVDKRSNSISIYDKSGKKVNSSSVSTTNPIRKIYSLGNYLAVEDIYGWPELLDISTGEFICDYVVKIKYYEENKTICLSRGTNHKDIRGYTLINENFNLEFSEYYEFKMFNNGFGAYDTENDKVYLYDLNGKIKKEITGIVKVEELTDDYFLYVSNDEKSKIISSKTGNIVWEPEITLKDMKNGYYMPYKYYENNIGIIELNDGFYNLNGEKLIEK